MSVPRLLARKLHDGYAPYPLAMPVEPELVRDVRDDGALKNFGTRETIAIEGRAC